jgi:hypothetical protein
MSAATQLTPEQQGVFEGVCSRCKVSPDQTVTIVGRMWVNLPGKPQLDANGVALRDDKGKIKYTSIFEWADRDASDRFAESVLATITARFGSDPLG